MNWLAKRLGGDQLISLELDGRSDMQSVHSGKTDFGTNKQRSLEETPPQWSPPLHLQEELLVECAFGCLWLPRAAKISTPASTNVTVKDRAR